MKVADRVWPVWLPFPFFKSFTFENEKNVHWIDILLPSPPPSPSPPSSPIFRQYLLKRCLRPCLIHLDCPTIIERVRNRQQKASRLDLQIKFLLDPFPARLLQNLLTSCLVCQTAIHDQLCEIEFEIKLIWLTLKYFLLRPSLEDSSFSWSKLWCCTSVEATHLWIRENWSWETSHSTPFSWKKWN